MANGDIIEGTAIQKVPANLRDDNNGSAMTSIHDPIKVQATISMASDIARKRVKNIQMDVSRIDKDHAWVALCAYIIENVGRAEMAQIVYDFMLGKKPRGVRVTPAKFTFDFFNQKDETHERFTVQFVEL